MAKGIPYDDAYERGYYNNRRLAENKVADFAWRKASLLIPEKFLDRDKGTGKLKMIVNVLAPPSRVGFYSFRGDIFL